MTVKCPLKRPQINQDKLSGMFIEDNKMAFQYHREMPLCSFQFGVAHQQFSIGSTNISSTSPSGNDENTCREKCTINRETTFHSTRYQLSISNSDGRTESLNFDSLSTSNLMLGRAILDKLPERIFGNFQIARVKWGQFQITQKSRG